MPVTDQYYPQLFQDWYSVEWGTDYTGSSASTSPFNAGGSWFGCAVPFAAMYIPSAGSSFRLDSCGIVSRVQSGNTVEQASVCVWSKSGSTLTKVLELDVTAQVEALSKSAYRELSVDFTSTYTDAQRTVNTVNGTEYYWGLMTKTESTSSTTMFSRVIATDAMGSDLFPAYWFGQNGQTVISSIDSLDTGDANPSLSDWVVGSVTISTQECTWAEFTSLSSLLSDRKYPLPRMTGIASADAAEWPAKPAYSVILRRMSVTEDTTLNSDLEAVQGNNTTTTNEFDVQFDSAGTDQVKFGAASGNQVAFDNTNGRADAEDIEYVINYWEDEGGTKRSNLAWKRMLTSEGAFALDPIWVTHEDKRQGTHGNDVTVTAFPTQIAQDQVTSVSVDRMVVGRPVWAFVDSQGATYSGGNLVEYRLTRNLASFLPRYCEILLVGRAGGRWYYYTDGTDATAVYFQWKNTNSGPGKGSFSGVLHGCNVFWMGLGINDTVNQLRDGTGTQKDWFGFARDFNTSFGAFHSEFQGEHNPYYNGLAFMGLPYYPDAANTLEQQAAEDVGHNLIEGFARMSRAPFYNPYSITEANPSTYIDADNIHYIDGATSTDNIVRNFVSVINKDGFLYTETLDRKQPYQALIKSIFQHYKADTSTGSLYDVLNSAGKFHFSRNPADETGSQLVYPFVVFEITSRTDYDAFDKDGEMVNIQFTVAADSESGGVEKVLQICDLLKERFETNQFTFSSGYGTYSLIEMQAGNLQGPFYDDKEAVGIFTFNVKYEEA